MTVGASGAGNGFTFAWAQLALSKGGTQGGIIADSCMQPSLGWQSAHSHASALLHRWSVLAETNCFRSLCVFVLVHATPKILIPRPTPPSPALWPLDVSALAYTVLEDGTLTVNSTAGPLLTAASSISPALLQVVGVVRSPLNGTLTSPPTASGAFVYRPNANFNGVDSFTYALNLRSGSLCSNLTATATITVGELTEAPAAAVLLGCANMLQPHDATACCNRMSQAGLNNLCNLMHPPITVAVDDPPTAINPAPFTGGIEDTPLNITAQQLLANVTDVDDTPAVTAVSSPSTAGGTVSLSGTTVLYTPRANFFGTDTFNYTITSGPVNRTLTATVLVAAVNVSEGQPDTDAAVCM